MGISTINMENYKPTIHHAAADAVFERDGLRCPMFSLGNELEGNANATRDNRQGAGFDAQAYATSPHGVPAVKTQPAREALIRVLNTAGATAPERDIVDARLVDEAGVAA
jgi:hypothetical protein